MMLSTTKNERGYAVVYGLVVLLLASVAGTGLLFMTQQGHIGATDYAKIRSASQAAVAALKACEGQFLNDPETAVEILKKYKDNNNNEWLLGDETNSNTEQRIKFWNGSDSPEYSARILGFDETNYFIKIEGIGYGGIGGNKHVVASYQLGGLGQNNIPIAISHGLFLGGTLENMNEPICIKGDVYLRILSTLSEQHFNRGGIIHGNLKTAQTSAKLDIGGPLTITGTGFFQCTIWAQGSNELSVLGKAGFTGGYYNWSAKFRLYDDAYFISPSSILSDFTGKNGMIVGQLGKNVRYSSPIPSSVFIGFNTPPIIDNSQDKNTIAANLSTTADTLSPIGLDLPTWETGVVEEISGNIYGSDLETYWNAHKTAGTLYQDKWLVLKMTGDVYGQGGTFTRNAIWITDDHIFNNSFFECSIQSNTFFIVNGSCVFNMKIPDNCKFRGLIYVKSSNSYHMTYEFGSNAILYGAIIHASQTAFDLNSGNCDSARIYFDDPMAQSALQEIMNTEILLAPGETSSSERSIELFDKKIRPTLLGMQL